MVLSRLKRCSILKSIKSFGLVVESKLPVDTKHRKGSSPGPIITTTAARAVATAGLAAGGLAATAGLAGLAGLAAAAGLAAEAGLAGLAATAGLAAAAAAAPAAAAAEHQFALPPKPVDHQHILY